jgi:hypothetical protein
MTTLPLQQACNEVQGTYDNSKEPDWNGGDPRVIVRDQAATAVFLDNDGDVVIWQRDTHGEEGRVFLTPDNARLVAKAILDAVGTTGKASASGDAPVNLGKVGAK